MSLFVLWRIYNDSVMDDGEHQGSPAPPGLRILARLILRAYLDTSKSDGKAQVKMAESDKSDANSCEDNS